MWYLYATCHTIWAFHLLLDHDNCIIPDSEPDARLYHPYKLTTHSCLSSLCIPHELLIEFKGNQLSQKSQCVSVASSQVPLGSEWRRFSRPTWMPCGHD